MPSSGVTCSGPIRAGVLPHVIRDNLLIQHLVFNRPLFGLAAYKPRPALPSFMRACASRE